RRTRGGVGAWLEHDGPDLVALALEPRRRLCADRLGAGAAGARAARSRLAASSRRGGVAGVAEYAAAHAAVRSRGGCWCVLSRLLHDALRRLPLHPVAVPAVVVSARLRVPH